MNRQITAACLLLATFAAPAALAGSKFSYPVSVDTVNRTASGSLGSARNSADINQYIGCWIYSYASGSDQGTCYARDANNISLSCSITSASMIDQIRSITPDSLIRFNVDASNNCSMLFVGNFSASEPKQP